MCGIVVDRAAAPFSFKRMALTSFDLESYYQLYFQDLILILLFGLIFDFISCFNSTNFNFRSKFHWNLADSNSPLKGSLQIKMTYKIYFNLCLPISLTIIYSTTAFDIKTAKHAGVSDRTFMYDNKPWRKLHFIRIYIRLFLFLMI